MIAFAVYVTNPTPWQRDDVAPITNTGVPTLVVTVTVAVPAITFEHNGAL